VSPTSKGVTLTMADVETEIRDLETQEQDIAKRKAALATEEQDVTVREGKVTALKLEEDRVRKSIDALRGEKRTKTEDFVENLRKENYESSLKRAAEEFGYKDNPTALKLLEDNFKKLDSGEATQEKIYETLVKAHLITDPTKYVQLDKDKQESKRAAEQRAAMSSGSALTGTETSVRVEDVQLDDIDMEAIRRTGIPEAKYKELKAKGLI
jgi:hypothetical protein